MSSLARFHRAPLQDFHAQVHTHATALAGGRFHLYAAIDPFTEEDLRDYVEDPLAALPPALLALLPATVYLYLVPYLDQSNGKEKPKPEKHAAKRTVAPRRRAPITAEQAALPPSGTVLMQKPGDKTFWRGVHWLDGTSAVVVLATGSQEIADYHYQFYRHLAMLAAEMAPPELVSPYQGLIREELNLQVHGEVDDERSWQLKQAFLRRRSQVRRDSKEFREYATQSYVDTLTLYLHGICCDIDVEPGPRQLPSRHLRRRLKLLREQFPPPAGYAVFPEELDRMASPAATANLDDTDCPF